MGGGICLPEGHIFSREFWGGVSQHDADPCYVVKVREVRHLAQAAKVPKAVVLGLPEGIRGGAGCEDMEFIAEDLLHLP